MSPSSYLEPPLRTKLNRDVLPGSRGVVIPAGTPVEVYYGDPDLDPKFHYAVRASGGRYFVAPGSALALLSPRRVVSV